MDEVVEALEKYKGLVPLVYDTETMSLDEARSEDMQYAVYLKREADKVIAGLKARTAELEALNHDLCERVTENDEIRLHWEEIEQTRAENERMKARIAELEEERRLRKFPDEKPEEWDTVIVRIGDGFYDIAVYLSNGQGWDIGDGTYHKPEEVTHWMPLPSAPKEKA